MYKYYLIFLILLCFVISSCSKKEETDPVIYKELDVKMNKIAESYVKLVLNVGLQDLIL